MSVLTMAACIVIMLILGATLELFNDAIQTSIWLAAWTFYQVPRHRFIALKQYQTILCVDAAISLLSVAFIALSDPTNLSEGIASIMLVGGLFLLLVIEISAKPSFKRIQMEPKGLEFGLMNFLGGGIMLSLVPLAAYFEGQEFAGAASMFMSIAAMALLIPRAISISSITTTSKLIDSPIKLREQTNIIRKKIKISSIAAATISALSGAVIITNHIHLVFWPNLAAAFALIILQNFFSTFGLAEANILTAKEESRTLLKINILAASSFLVAAIALLWIEPINSFIYLCAILAGLNFYRAQQNIKFTKAYLGKL